MKQTGTFVDPKHAPHHQPPTPLVIAGSILFFLTATTGLTFFNKWFLNHSSVNFKFPFAIGAWHQLFVFIYTVALENVFLAKVAGPITRKPQYFKILGPIGFMCALDWGSSNFSLTSVPLSLYEMIKSSTPVFTLLISIAVGLQPPAVLLLTAIGTISIGTYTSVVGDQGMGHIFSVGFPIVGATVLLMGSFFSGLKTVTSQFVMQKLVDPDTGKSDVNAVTMLYYLAPITSLSLAGFSFAMERDRLVAWVAAATTEQLAWTAFMLTASAVIAFLVTISGFVLTRKTSAVTYSVVKISQRVGIVGLAMIIFHEHVGFYNGLGFAVSLAGIALYNYYEIVHKHKKHVDAISPQMTPSSTPTTTSPNAGTGLVSYSPGVLDTGKAKSYGAA